MGKKRSEDSPWQQFFLGLGFPFEDELCDGLRSFAFPVAASNSCYCWEFARSGASLAYLVTQNFLIHTTPPDNFTVTLTSEVVFFLLPNFLLKKNNANGWVLLDVLVEVGPGKHLSG